jgi:hypothetical protein
MDNRQKWIEDMRQFVDLIEQHPELPVPYINAVTGFLDEDAQKEHLARIAKDFAPVKKSTSDWHFGVSFQVNETINFTVFARRESVCRKIKKTVMVPELVIPAAKALVIPAHEKTVEEWDCSPILGPDMHDGSTIDSQIETVEGVQP